MVLIPVLKLVKFVLGTFVKPFILLCFKVYYRNIDKSFPLPPVETPWLLLPAHKLAKKIRNKELTSTEVVQAYIRRIDQVQPFLNCVVKTYFEEALEEARKVDELLASDSISEKYNEENAPILGVPFSCKECFSVKGGAMATGVIARRDNKCTTDCDIVTNMRNAGGILLCLTNTSEFCMWLESRNPLYGVTRNPYNLSRIVGGSSGGEGCLISSAGALIGIASDIGGSIRMPSFFNGVYGHKSSYGLISNKEQYPFPEGELKTRMLSSGPICRYASDLKFMFKIQAGPILFKQISANFEKDIDLKSLNYYVIADQIGGVFSSKVNKSCENAMNKAIGVLESSLGVKVKPLHLKAFEEDSFFIWKTLINNGKPVYTPVTDLLKQMEPYNPYYELFKLIIGQSNHSAHAVIYALHEQFPTPNPEKYIRLFEGMKKELNAILGDNSIILSYGFPTTAPYHNSPLLLHLFDFIYFGVYNSLGLPSTQCPIGLCPKTNLPVGIQIVSNVNCDHLTIRLAEYFEENLIGWVPPFRA